MSYAIEGKRVLVTGASTGIGAALAEGFAARGAVVGICARRATLLADVLDRVQKHSPESRAWTVDLSDLDTVEEFARRADADGPACPLGAPEVPLPAPGAPGAGGGDCMICI